MKNNSVLKKKSLNPSNWEIATLDVIAHQGVNAVAIESLARDLGVTKGSFYWHFSNRMDLIEAALKRWCMDDRKVIEEKVLTKTDPKEQLKSWFLLSAEPSQSHLIYATLLADRQHKVVSRVLKEVTVERLNYLQQAYAKLGYSDAKARKQALLAYSVYVGYLHMAKTLHGNLKDAQSVEEYAQFVANQLIV